MNRLIRSLLFSVLFVITSTLSSGCLFVVAGAAGGTVAYVKGALQVSLDGPIDDVADASAKAVKDLKFILVSKRIDAVSGEVLARTAKDVKVQIILKKQTEKTTQVDIRIGTFGDRMLSQQVLDEIRKNL